MNQVPGSGQARPRRRPVTHLDADAAAIDRAVRAALPGVELGFLARTPFGYHDPAAIEAELREAGFAEVAIERVERTSPPGSAERLARGMCEGSPLAHELAGQSAEARERAFAAAREAAVAAEESGGLAMAALVVTARG